MLESSMRQYGYVSPMTAAADGEIIDGSARIETSVNVFGDDAIVVHHDGTKPIIMVRDDIPSADTPEARAISMAANRIAQVNLDFDAEVILGDLQAGVDLSKFWNESEVDALIHGLSAPDDGDWMAAFEGKQSQHLDTVNVTFVLQKDEWPAVKQALERFHSDKNQALVAMAKHA